MKKTSLLIPLIFVSASVFAQQEFFLDTWEPKIIQAPEFEEAAKSTDPVSVSLIIHATDTISRIPVYIFGDNANSYTGSMSDNKKLMKHIANRNMGILRGPSGSISDVYFWNRSEYNRPVDVPNTLLLGMAHLKIRLLRPPTWQPTGYVMTMAVLNSGKSEMRWVVHGKLATALIQI
jgi:hypothetical protein